MISYEVTTLIMIRAAIALSLTHRIARTHELQQVVFGQVLIGRVASNLGTVTNRTGNRVLLHYFFGRDSGGTKPATR